MEGSGRELPRADTNFLKNVVNFEEELKTKLRWNKQQWSVSGEANCRMNKLCNSLFFWKEKLKPAVDDVSIIITLYNRDHDVRVEIIKIIEAIESLDEAFRVEGIANFRNPRYVCLYFQNKEIRDRVKEVFRMIDDNFVVYLTWALKGENNVSKLTVHWLPLNIDIDIIKEKLEKYVVCLEETKKKLVFMSGREMPTAKIEFKVSFKKDVTAEIVPHLMDVFNMEALITIGGRKPLCLNCDRLGHISRECELRFCESCKVLKPKKHVCLSVAAERSYADTVKLKSQTEAATDPDELEENVIVINNQSISTDKQILADKINFLENQLKLDKQNESCSVKDRMEKKRKFEQTGPSESPNINAEEIINEWAEDSDSSIDSMEYESNEKSDINEVAAVGEINAESADSIILKKKKK